MGVMVNVEVGSVPYWMKAAYAYGQVNFDPNVTKNSENNWIAFVETCQSLWSYSTEHCVPES